MIHRKWIIQILYHEHRCQIRKDLGRNLVSRWLGWESPCGVSILFSEPFFSGSLWSELDWNVHYLFWASTYWSQRNLSLCLLTLRLAESLTLEPLTDRAGPLPHSLIAQEPGLAHWSQRSTALLADHAGTLSYAFIVQGTLSFTGGAGAAFSQWQSGFISPGSSGLCMLVAGKGFKASSVCRVSSWSEFKLKMDPLFASTVTLAV